MFHSADPKDIKEGKMTDVYFKRTMEILHARAIDKKVVMEMFTRKLPKDWEWSVFAGVEECAQLLEGLKVNAWMPNEGTIFKATDPIMYIEGMYTDFGMFETSILGLVCQASGIATMAARCRKAAGEKVVASFGARRMHPILAPMIERNAFIGGCDGVATVTGAELIGEEPVGTMPHALILIVGDTVEVVKAFNEIIDKKVGRVALIDTFNDEKFEALRVAEAMGKDLFAIRLDTPSSRRGDFKDILKEVRWELDIRGYKDVKLFASGGIDEYSISDLNEIADAYGVGTSISNAPVVDFSYDIVEIEGKPFAKRGKKSGVKKLLRCPKCYNSKWVYKDWEDGKCDCGSNFENLLKPLIKDGKVVRDLPKPQEIRQYVIEQLEYYPLNLTQ